MCQIGQQSAVRCIVGLADVLPDAIASYGLAFIAMTTDIDTDPKGDLRRAFLDLAAARQHVLFARHNGAPADRAGRLVAQIEDACHACRALAMALEAGDER
jgi:hypothetical protein